MSSPLYAITPTLFTQPSPATFIAATALLGRIVVDATPGAAASGTSPALYGGCSVIDFVATSSDSVARDLVLYKGLIATTQGAATGAITATTSTLTRATAGFIGDGWRVGDLLMAFAPATLAPNAAVDGILAIVTAVTDTVLTVNGTPLAALTLAAGTRICRVSQHYRAPVAIGAGTNSTTASAGLLNNSLDGSAVKTELKLGAANMLIAALPVAVSALPAYLSVAAVVALY